MSVTEKFGAQWDFIMYECLGCHKKFSAIEIFQCRICDTGDLETLHCKDCMPDHRKCHYSVDLV